MGLVYAKIELINAEDIALARREFLPSEAIRSMKVKAMVDSGAYMLVIPRHVQIQLGLAELGQREALTADGASHTVPVAGPLRVQFENRFAICNALVMGGSAVLLGAIPMEELDVIIEPRTQRLVVNPENPTMPKMVVMNGTMKRDYGASRDNETIRR